MSEKDSYQVLGSIHEEVLEMNLILLHHLVDTHLEEEAEVMVQEVILSLHSN